MNPTTALLEGVRHTLVFVRWLIKRLLVPALAIVGGVVVIGLIIFAVVIAGGETSTTQVPDRVVLEVNLERRLIEYVPQDPLAQALLLTEKPLTLRDLTDGIQHAAGDQRVVGLITRVGAVPMGLATIFPNLSENLVRELAPIISPAPSMRSICSPPVISGSPVSRMKVRFSGVASTN